MVAATSSKGKLFFVSFLRRSPHNQAVTGAFLNALGILLGGLLGLLQPRPFSLRVQYFFKSVLGALVIVFALQLIWDNLAGSLLTCLKELFLVAVAVVAGFWVGRLLRLQTISNRLGRHAGNLISGAQKNPPGKPADGFVAGTILFCAAPLGIVGAVADGVGGCLTLLALKGIMDALASAAFVQMFRWPAALSAIPVYLFLTAITEACHSLAGGVLAVPALAHPVMVAAGFVTACLPMIIFEVRRVELANFLPALAVAPLLAKFFGWN